VSYRLSVLKFKGKLFQTLGAATENRRLSIVIIIIVIIIIYIAQKVTSTNVLQIRNWQEALLHRPTVPVRRYVCIHQVALLFYVKSRHGSHLEIMTSYQTFDSVNRCIVKQSCQISSRIFPIRFWNDCVFRLFWRRRAPAI